MDSPNSFVFRIQFVQVLSQRKILTNGSHHPIGRQGLNAYDIYLPHTLKDALFFLYIQEWTSFHFKTVNLGRFNGSLFSSIDFYSSYCHGRSILFCLKQNSFDSETKQFKNCFKTVLFQFHFVVQTVLVMVWCYADIDSAAEPVELRVKYKIGAEIGEGNFAVVKECTEK